MIKRAVTPEAALDRLQSLCAHSEQCSTEMMLKLRRWNITGDDAERIIDSLIDQRFIDDNRYAHAYVRDKFRFNKWGRRKIAAMLASKRIDRQIIAEAIDEEIDNDEYFESLKNLLQARLRHVKAENAREKASKLYAFATARGFESELIMRAIKLTSQPDKS